MFNYLSFCIHISVQSFHLPSQPISDQMFSDTYLDYMFKCIQIFVWVVVFSSRICLLFIYLKYIRVVEYSVSLFLGESNYLQAGYKSEIFSAQIRNELKIKLGELF